MLTGLSALDLLSAAAFAHEEHRANPEHEHEYPLDPALEQQFAPFQNAQLPPLPSEPFEPYEHPSPPPPPPPPPPVGQQEQEQPDEDGDKTDDDDTLVGPRITFKRPRDDADDPDPGRQLALGAHVEPPSFFASSALPSLASLGTFPPSSLPPLPSLSSAFLPPLPDLAHFTVLPPIPTTTSPYHPAPPPPHAHPQSLPHWVPEDAGLIRCVCPYTSDDGFTIQCDMCNVWQHAGCVSISPEDVPDEYLCELCDPRGAHERGVDGQRAEESQRRRMEAELRRAGDGEMRRGASVGVGAQVRQHQEIIQQQLQQQQQQQQREHEHAVAVAAAVAHEQPAPRGKPRRSLTDDGLATPADASPVESLPATPAPAPPAPPRNARKRGSAKQAAPNGSSAPSRSRAAGNPPTPAQSSVSTPSNDHQPDHHRHQQAPLTAPRSNGHGPAVTPAYSDDDDVDERYETWQYEYTPVDRNLYPDASLVARLVNVLADDAHPLLRDLWDRQAAARPRAKDPLVPLLYDSAPVEFDTLPTPAPTAVKPLTGATFHLAPPIASTYVPSSNQGSACPYPRPTVHALFATAPIAAGAFVGALHGEVVPLATYRADPLSQYALLGVPKQGVRTLPVPWSVAIDQRRFGNELRFARCGCHPNAVVRVVRLGSSEPDSPVAWASQASAGRALLGQLVFAVFATVDIGRRDEIVLPWDWDDDHIVHALQGLMLAPPLPRGIVHDDLEPLARKMAIVATTLLGTNHCACDKKRDCALFWMCRAAGATAPMSKAAAAKREPFATILLNAMGAAKDDGAARGKARKAKKPDVGPLLGLERGWIKREPRVVEPAPPAPEHEPLPVLDVVVEPHREDEKENVDAMEVDQPTPVEPKSSLADLPPPPTPLASTSSLPTLAVTVIELPPPAEPTPSTASKRRQSTSRPAPPRIEDDVDSDGSDLTEPLSHRSDDDLAPASTKADESDDDAPPAPVRRRIPVPAKRTAKDVGPARKKPRTVVEDKDKNRKKKLDKGKGRARESSDEPPAAAVERKAVAPAAPEPPKEKKKKQIVVIKKVTETLVEKPVDLVALREKKERKEREREKDRKDREKAQREKDREEKRERERRREEEEDEQSDESSESEDDPPPPPPKKRGSKAKPPAAAPAPAPREPSPVVDPVEAARLEAMIFDGPAEVVVHKPASPPPPPPPPRKLTMEDYRRMRKNPDAAAQSADPASLESAVVAKADVPATVDVVMAEPVPDVPPVLEPAPEPIVIEVVKEPTPPPPPPPAPRARLSLAAYRQRQQEQAQKPSDAPNESLAMPAVSASELVASPLTTPSLAQPTPPPTTTSASDSAPVPSSFNSAAAEDVLKRLGDYFSSQAAPAPVAPAAPVPPPSGPLSYTRALRRPTPPRRPSPPPRRERSRTPPTPDPHSPRSPILPAFDIPLRAPASFIKPELRRTSGGGLGLDAELPLSTREYGRQPSVYTSSSFSLGKSDSGSPMLSISPSLFQQPLPAAFSPPARSPSLQPAPPPNAPTGPRASPTLRYDRPPGEIPTGPRASPNAGYSLGGSGRAYNRPLPDVGASSYAQPAPLTYGPGPIPATGASAVPLGPRGFGALANNAPRASWPPQGHTQGPTTPGFRGTPRGHFVPRGPSMRGGRGGGPPPGPVGPSSRGIMRGRGGGLQGDGGWGPSRGRGRGRG